MKELSGTSSSLSQVARRTAAQSTCALFNPVENAKCAPRELVVSNLGVGCPTLLQFLGTQESEAELHVAVRGGKLGGNRDFLVA